MFNIATNIASLTQLGIDPSSLVGMQNPMIAPERRAMRQSLLQRKDRKSLLEDLARAMATPASEQVRNLSNTHYMAPFAQRAIGTLDATSTYGGNILPRVDIEDYLWALFVTEFPFWERINNGPANGLLHTSIGVAA